MLGSHSTVAQRVAVVMKFVVLGTVTLGGATEGRAQSFLEKLEATVREQLGATPDGTNPAGQVSGEGVLPAPTQNTPALTPPASRPQSSSPSILEGGIPGLLPAPGGGLELSGPAGSKPPMAAAAPGTGGVYLGLEAEETLGGGIGVRVAAVTQQSPAWKAGFEVGDRILAVAGFSIANIDGLAEQLSSTVPGQSVRFLISRGGRNLELTTVLMDANLAGRIAEQTVEPEHASGAPWLGVVVNDLTSSFRQQFGISVFRGAAVTSVASGSPAAAAGIGAGDAIIEAGGKPIETARDLIAWMSSALPGQEVELIVYRGAFPRSVRLVLEVNPADRPARSLGRPTVPNPTSGIASPQAAIPGGPQNGLGSLPTPSVELPSSTSPNMTLPVPFSPGAGVAGDALPVPAQSDPAEAKSQELVELANQLRAENEVLRNELGETQEKLRAMEERLNRVLELLQGGRG